VREREKEKVSERGGWVVVVDDGGYREKEGVVRSK
jgi:hypothetical protein